MNERKLTPRTQGFLRPTNGPRVYLGWIGEEYLTPLREGLSYAGLASRIKPGDLVFLKPNLTFPHYKEGVMTSPECIEQLVVVLKDLTSNIVIGEADGGGYNRFPMDAVFEKTGIAAMAKRHGVKLVNLSRVPSRHIHFEYKNRRFDIPLPAFLLDETSFFVTVPVPKVHANTRISVSVKNQWGCIQDPSLRLSLHPFFKKVILEINRAVRAQWSVVDGRYGLNRNGPLRGEPVKLGWVVVSNSVVTADLVCTSLMGIDPRSVDYLTFCEENGEFSGWDHIDFNRNYREFAGPTFCLRREFLDYPGYLAFRSPALAYLAYHSPLAGLLHRVLYLFREKFYDHR